MAKKSVPVKCANAYSYSYTSTSYKFAVSLCDRGFLKIIMIIVSLRLSLFIFYQADTSCPIFFFWLSVRGAIRQQTMLRVRQGAGKQTILRVRGATRFRRSN